MPPEKRPIQRIVFIGAECTGKTTLALNVAKHYNEPCSGEYVRDHVEKLDRPLNRNDLEPIARGQIRLEDEAAASATNRVFHDTNLLSSILYAEHYFDTHIDWVDNAFLKRNYAHYFLCKPDIPWEADPGQRESPEERHKLQSLFKAILLRYNLTYTEIAGTIEQRKAIVIKTLTAIEYPLKPLHSENRI